MFAAVQEVKTETSKTWTCSSSLCQGAEKAQLLRLKTLKIVLPQLADCDMSQELLILCVLYPFCWPFQIANSMRKEPIPFYDQIEIIDRSQQFCNCNFIVLIYYSIRLATECNSPQSSLAFLVVEWKLFCACNCYQNEWNFETFRNQRLYSMIWVEFRLWNCCQLSWTAVSAIAFSAQDGSSEIFDILLFLGNADDRGSGLRDRPRELACHCLN